MILLCLYLSTEVLHVLSFRILKYHENLFKLFSCSLSFLHSILKLRSPCAICHSFFYPQSINVVFSDFTPVLLCILWVYPDLPQTLPGFLFWVACRPAFFTIICWLIYWVATVKKSAYSWWRALKLTNWCYKKNKLSGLLAVTHAPPFLVWGGISFDRKLQNQERIFRLRSIVLSRSPFICSCPKVLFLRIRLHGHNIQDTLYLAELFKNNWLSQNLRNGPLPLSCNPEVSNN